MDKKAFAVRTLVAVVYGPLMIASVWFGGPLLFGLILAVVLLSYWEYSNLARFKSAYAQPLPGLAAAAAGVVLIAFRPNLLLGWAFVAVTLFFFVELYRRKGSPLINLAVTTFGAFYYPLFLGSFLLLRRLPKEVGLADSVVAGWMLMVLAVTWVCDTAAYVAGSYLGRHKLMVRISPGKTVEGAVAGFIFGLLTAYLCHITFIRGLELIDSMVIGFLVSTVGQYGDLFESMLKRDAGVKDSSHLIPGHGGFLDRFDSLTTVMPIVYLYIRLAVV